MQIDWWTLGLQTVNALVLIWLLSRFLFRPIAAILAERRAAAAHLLEEAAAKEAAARALEEKAQAALDAIASDRAASVRAATLEAEEARRVLLEAARAEAERTRAGAQAEIERDRKSEERAEASRANQLALDIARRLLERLPPSSQVTGFVDGLVKGVGALSAEARGEFSRRADAVLRAPRALTAEEEALCRGALTKAFGEPVRFATRADPSLLAGLELENEHTSIRNSLRADLERISAELLKAQDG
ncbi:F0F1 ATP synthase subunit delta [Methylocystis bryophila]|uniref:ATP synthase subunit b n=1 Tax=Methylocystis bryophila TaxID=655015 RepID=A0A1W6MWJ6_9HYPH|nr:F0F1 ATP synthase subunit delta [Methylocystis bryophila]ARN81971.1 F0F1 ATP synthase subunit B [Methylocystis bryophila]BDV38069.1 ATP synthase subunit b [Methylocystis bryophila]